MKQEQIREILKHKKIGAREGQLQILQLLEGYIEGLLRDDNLEDSDRVTLIFEKIKELQQVQK